MQIPEQKVDLLERSLSIENTFVIVRSLVLLFRQLIPLGIAIEATIQSPQDNALPTQHFIANEADAPIQIKG